MLNRLQKEPHNTPRAHSPAVWLTLTAISIASLIGIPSHSAFAQDAQSAAAQAAAMRAVARGGMSEDQVVAMHALLKRARPAMPTQVASLSFASGAYTPPPKPHAEKAKKKDEKKKDANKKDDKKSKDNGKGGTL